MPEIRETNLTPYREGTDLKRDSADKSSSNIGVTGRAHNPIYTNQEYSNMSEKHWKDAADGGNGLNVN